MHRAQDGFVSSHLIRRCLVKHVLAHLCPYEIEKTEHAGLVQRTAGSVPCLGSRCGPDLGHQATDSHPDRR
jgi:hypothetical protein